MSEIEVPTRCGKSLTAVHAMLFVDEEYQHLRYLDWREDAAKRRPQRSLLQHGIANVVRTWITYPPLSEFHAWPMHYSLSLHRVLGGDTLIPAKNTSFSA